MKNYRVFHAGWPEEAIDIEAASPKEAALRFFKERRQTDPIVVEAGLWKEEIFYWNDIRRMLPELTDEELSDVKQRKNDMVCKKQSFWKEFWHRLWIQNRY